jgi:hypothetical protein
MALIREPNLATFDTGSNKIRFGLRGNERSFEEQLERIGQLLFYSRFQEARPFVDSPKNSLV